MAYFTEYFAAVIGKGAEGKFATVAELIPASKDGTIRRKSGQQAFTQHLSIIMGDAEEVSQHYRLMTKHTRDCLGVSFRCYAYIPVSEFNKLILLKTKAQEILKNNEITKPVATMDLAWVGPPL
ncbi:hypothetical protein Bca4012_082386 [Brassica carinata]